MRDWGDSIQYSKIPIIISLICISFLPCTNVARAQHPTRVIRYIRILPGGVFDQKDTRFRKFPFIWVSRLHRNTRSSVIRRELLFAPGDSVAMRLLKESARNLRALPFLKDAKIDTHHIGECEADILVNTSDHWTTGVG